MTLEIFNGDVKPFSSESFGYKAYDEQEACLRGNNYAYKTKIDSKSIAVPYWVRHSGYMKDWKNSNIDVTIRCRDDNIIYEIDRSRFIPPFISRRMTIYFHFVEKVEKQYMPRRSKFIHIYFGYHACRISDGKIAGCYKKYDS